MAKDGAYATLRAYVTVVDTRAITVETKQNKTKQNKNSTTY
jgi:hypothetical protein